MRGHKSGHKGQKRLFTNPEELQAQKSKEDREREWRQRRGQVDSDSDEESNSNKDSNSESSSEEEEEQSAKAKGVEGLIEIENPNRVVHKMKKVSQLESLEENAKPELSRREREELEKQKAKATYARLHAAGKTEDARADLARLALIKKQREEAARKREDERLKRDAEAKAKAESTNKALGKNRKI